VAYDHHHQKGAVAPPATVTSYKGCKHTESDTNTQIHKGSKYSYSVKEHSRFSWLLSMDADAAVPAADAAPAPAAAAGARITN
jgi:hypothetical protein